MALPLLTLALLPATGLGPPAAEAVSPRNFSISTPFVRAHGDALAVSGTVCRRANFYGLSPPRVQVEAIGPDGAVVAKSYAFLAELSRWANQRCAPYRTMLKTQSRPVTRVRVCAAGHGDCPAH